MRYLIIGFPLISFRGLEGSLLLPNLAGIKISDCIIPIYHEVYPPSQTKTEPVT